MIPYTGENEYTIEVFDDYDGTWLYWTDKSLDITLTSNLKENIKNFGKYFLNSLHTMSYVCLKGYVAEEIVIIQGRNIKQNIFVLNSIYNNNWNEYEPDEINEALEETRTSKFIIYDGK